jgi:hypothetical protein
MAESREQRVSIGFQGGQVLSVRLSSLGLESLNRALDSGGWHELETDEGTARVRAEQVVYVQIDSDEPRVGFGA